MPVAKHRRASKPGTRKPEPNAPRQPVSTLEELRAAIANPALDFSAKAVIAGVWWYRQLLRKAGDRQQSAKPSWKDRQRAAVLLCVAMDGEPGENDDLAPAIATMLRPYCPAASFSGAWEQAHQMPPGTVIEAAARILSQTRKPAA